MAELFIHPKDGEPFVFSLKEPVVSIGRSPENDLALADHCCSSRHAQIAATDRGYAVKDLGSKNGTFVNGKRIQAETPLRMGDEILIGSTKVVFGRDVSTQIEMMNGTSLTQNLDTILQVKDILKKPVLEKTTKAKMTALEMEKALRQQEFLAVLNEVSQALIYHFPLGQLLEYIMDLITKHIPMDRGVLMLKEGKEGQLVPKVLRVLNAGLKKQNIQVSQSILNMALAKNQAILLSDIQSDTNFRAQESVIRSHIYSAMCVPLWNNQEIIGIIYSDRMQGLERFTEDDLKLLILLGNLAAVKIENAKLFEQALEKGRMERELALAAEIQKNFLPQENPTLKNYEVCGSNRSCCQVGGDYYDFIPIDDARLGILIADVSGKGVSASLLMASLRAALHAEIHPRYDLAALVSKLNEFVHRSSDSHNFISFVFCEYNTETGEASYVNAGHNPPLRLDRDGKVHRLESTGFCLGMFPRVTFGLNRFEMGPGDVTCFFTDGITESRNEDGEEFGEERLIELLRKLRQHPAHQIMDKILDGVDSFSTCVEVQDDMTMVIMKRLA